MMTFAGTGLLFGDDRGVESSEVHGGLEASRNE